MEPVIRRAALEDCEAICRIHVSAIRRLCASHYAPAVIATWSAGRTPTRYEKHIRDRCVLVAEHDSEPIGFGTLDASTGEIVQLYVAPGHARRGVGRRLLAELLREAQEHGLHEVRLLSSLNAEGFYARAGFQSGERTAHTLGGGATIDVIPMRKDLGHGGAGGARVARGDGS